LVLRWIVVVGLGIAGLAILLVVTGLGSMVGIYAYYVQDLPEPGEITIVEENFETTRIYDRSGEVLLYEIIDPLGGDRQWVELDDIPLELRNATVAIEDSSFYDRPQIAGVTLGLNVEGITRAFVQNLGGGQVQGGSSITQQLVKNVLIEPEERNQITYARKIKEIILATEIESNYSKDRILEWYLNTNFYGNLAYGIEAASQVYFGKTASQLTLAESAMLAAIPQFPAINPIDNPEFARERQALVLEKMVEDGYITRAQADAALAEEIQVRPVTQRFDLVAPHFAIYVRKQLEDRFGPDLAYRGGLRVYTTLDLGLQYQVECVARTHVTRLSGVDSNYVEPTEIGTPCTAAEYLPPLQPSLVGVDQQASNASVVVIRPQTGEIVAMVGSLDYYDESIDGNFNVALGLRQPGSAFKPFTYITAFSQGYTPATMTLDVRTAFDQGAVQPYVPENYDRRFHGPQSIRSALANSYNIPAVQVMEWVGVDNVIRAAHSIGISTLTQGLDQYGLALTLGGGEVTLLDMTYAYATLANTGQMKGTPVLLEDRRPGFRTLDPVAILRVEDRDGNILWEYGKDDTYASNDILSPSLAYLVTDILSDEQARRPAMGDNSPLNLSHPAAAKTGTTNDIRDTWTIGYTSQLVTGVWIGNSDGSPMVDLSGLTGAAPIWHAVMEYELRDEPVLDWERPPDIVEVTVCRVSGLLPTQYCPTYKEIFIAGTEPTHYDNVYQPFQINKETNLLSLAPSRLSHLGRIPTLVAWCRSRATPPERASCSTDSTMVRGLTPPNGFRLGTT
jgi:membrane peptidoglycan carboxypeptidase